MNKEFQAIDTKYGAARGTFPAYVAGFFLSIILTLCAYGLVAGHILNGSALIAMILVLGVGQLFVQLVFFLHLSRKSHSRWNLAAALFAMTLVIILVLGTIWIMDNLNYNMTMSFIQNTSVLTAY